MERVNETPADVCRHVEPMEPLVQGEPRIPHVPAGSDVREVQREFHIVSTLKTWRGRRPTRLFARVLKSGVGKLGFRSVKVSTPSKSLETYPALITAGGIGTR